MHNPTVLITSIGRNTFFAKRLRQALQQRTDAPRLIGIDASWSAPGLQFVDDAYTVPRSDSDSYVPTINRIIEAEAVDYVLPTKDVDLLAFTSRWDNLTNEAVFLMPDPDSTMICTDKVETAELFDSLGLTTPKTNHVSRSSEWEGEYPAVVKSRGHQGTTRGFSIADDKVDLQETLQEYGSPIVQNYVGGPEYTVDVVCDFDGNPLRIIPRERLSLRDAVSDKGKTVADRDIIDQTKSIVSAIEPRGFLNAQCIRTDHRLVWIEINPRISGGIPLAIEAGGVDELFAKLLLGEATDAVLAEYEEGLYMAKHDDAVFLTESERPSFREHT